MPERPNVSRVQFTYDAPLATTPALPKVGGAKQDGGMQVVRRQVVEGFDPNWRPERVTHPSITLVCPQSEDPLLSIVKNVIDGLDSGGVVFNDRQVVSVRAVIDKTETVTNTAVIYDMPCGLEGDRCEDSCPRTKIRPCMSVWEASSETLARPAGSRPLVSPTGEAVSRDIDAYVSDLRSDEANVRWVDGSIDDLRSMVAAASALRVDLELRTNAFADIENVAARLVHLVHVMAHDGDRSPLEVWNASPSVEYLIEEVRMCRDPNLLPGTTVTIETIDPEASPASELIEYLRKVRSTQTIG